MIGQTTRYKAIDKTNCEILTQLVSIATFLTLILPSAQSYLGNLLSIWFCREKAVNSGPLYLETKPAPKELTLTLLELHNVTEIPTLLL
jgi:hypothetical protein